MFVIALLTLLPIQNNTSQTDATKVLLSCLQRYHDAKTLSGTIEFIQTARGSSGVTSVTVTTKVQAAKPNLFYIEQSRQPQSQDSGVRNHFWAACNGKQIGYTLPSDALPLVKRGSHDRLYEPAPPTISEGLDIFCTLLVDRSLPVSLALYNAYEVQQFVNRLSNLKLEEDTKFEGKDVYRIRSDYTYTWVIVRGEKTPVKIPAYLYIDKEYNFLGMVWEETIQGEVQERPTRISDQVKITNQRIVRIQINSPVDEALFRMR